jgi:hypothetical protein
LLYRIPRLPSVHSAVGDRVHGCCSRLLYRIPRLSSVHSALGGRVDDCCSMLLYDCLLEADKLVVIH